MIFFHFLTLINLIHRNQRIASYVLRIIHNLMICNISKKLVKLKFEQIEKRKIILIMYTLVYITNLICPYITRMRISWIYVLGFFILHIIKYFKEVYLFISQLNIMEFGETNAWPMQTYCMLYKWLNIFI